MSRAGPAVLLLVAACAAGSGGRPGSTARPPRVAVLPVTNVSGTPVPARELTAAVEQALATAGVEVVGGARLEEWLADHRIRWVAGVDRAAAVAAGEELGVDAIAVPTVTSYGTAEPPRLGLELRLVEAAEEGRLLWADARVRAGDDEPGLLGLGVVRELSRVQHRVLTELATGLARFLAGERRPTATTCVLESRFEPRIAYRAALDFDRTYTVAVLPFQNQTDRAEADEVVAMQLVRQLQAQPRLSVLEPGVVRERLLGNRIVMQGGVSLDTARLVLGSMGADLIVTGTVRRYEDGPGGAARVAFSVTVLDTRARRVVWRSSSDDAGGEGLRLFDRGRVRAAPELACRMARHVADAMGPRGR